ncbi:MAG: response regulator [Acidimicrobiia bacterium]
MAVVVMARDDDRGAVEAALGPGTFRVRWLADGKEALSLLAEEDCDLALVDLGMPGTDGRELLSELKCDSRLWHVPVFVIADATETDAVAHCLEVGADDYVLRPLHPALLARRVDTFLAKRRFHDLEAEYVKIFQEQAADIKELTRDLAQRVLHQAEERDRLERLRRFLPSELVDLTRGPSRAPARDAPRAGGSLSVV